ncbi:hypothetical protein [Streptomyces sp. NBC_01185]|uniref:hypothetical protein n=1 Tax=Streptomyces sp. NBC_01185 TaxID=2903764 RepID=UPI003863C9DE|nr:hypothetical protein OG770_13290 [Streptomyces sp. NBC_01185]
MSEAARPANPASRRTAGTSGSGDPAPDTLVVVYDLVVGEDEAAPGSPGSAGRDPLREPDALREAQLLDWRVDRPASTAALLFELRTARQLDEGNTALLVMRGLRSFDWTAGAAPEGPTARTVVSGVPGHLDGLFRAEFSFFPDSRLEMLGQRSEFYVLEAEGIGDVPPDRDVLPDRDVPPGRPDGEAPHVRGLLPSWDSLCTVLRTSVSP